MSVLRSTPPPNCLALAEPGQLLAIQRIHFGIVRDRCHELGIREGAPAWCERTTARDVVIRFPEGHTVALERHYAWFVELEDGVPGG